LIIVLFVHVINGQ